MARYGYPLRWQFYRCTEPCCIVPQQQSGFDYGIEIYDRHNRLSGEIVYYDNTLKNMFVDNALPPQANGFQCLSDHQCRCNNEPWMGIFQGDIN